MADPHHWVLRNTTMCEDDSVDTRVVELEAIRVRTKIGSLAIGNRELLEDLLEGASTVELARDYTSGDKRMLHERLRKVLVHQLGFDPSIPMPEVLAALAIAFEHKNVSIQ
jgi:hypothetical protein